MLQGTLRLLTILFFISPLLISAQNISISSFADDWEDDYDVWNWYSNKRPFMELNYGIGQMKHKGISSTSFAETGRADLRLGFSELDFMYKKSIVELNERFLMISYMSADISKDEASAGELSPEFFRFGFANRSGYGYKVGPVSIVPYSQEGWIWTRLNMPVLPGNANDLERIERFDKAIRFGDAVEGGMKLTIASVISLNASYEASTVYPRHMFWHWTASQLVESAGRGLVDWFIDEIFDASPGAAPVMEFLLKNAWNFTYYSLKRDGMSFPISSEKPLTFETIKVGFTVNF